MAIEKAIDVVDLDWSPVEVRPADVSVAPSPAGLCDYVRQIGGVRELLTQEKAICFRDFDVTAGTVEDVIPYLLPNRMTYVHGNSPRSKVGPAIYTSTEYPPEYLITMHHELSYAAHWPERLLFFCEVSPESGGATPVVDAARWLGSIDPAVREAFRGGVRYTQNLHSGAGLGRSWQATFETSERDEVERLLDEAGATWQWLPDGLLRVSQVRPATTVHPVTGAEVWFNQADQWHPSSLGEDAQLLRELMPPEQLPQFASFADGSEIPEEYLVHIKQTGLDQAVDVEWHAGDVLVVDNVLVAHGRRPFTGPRRVLVAMSASH